LYTIASTFSVLAYFGKQKHSIMLASDEYKLNCCLKLFRGSWLQGLANAKTGTEKQRLVCCAMASFPSQVDSERLLNCCFAAPRRVELAGD
jgi:hypothetical protein